MGCHEAYLAWASADWPAAAGVVQSASVERRPGDKGRGTFHADIRYRFAVAGKTFDGKRVAFGDYDASGASHANSVVNRYPKGKAVQVRYRTGSPDVCVLESGLKAQAWFLPVFGLVFIAVGLLILVFGPRHMRPPASPASAERQP